MAEIGQIVFNQAGTTSWVVPAGVTSICGVAIGPASRNTSSGGGGLSWRNNIPVTPGETLTIQVGANQTTIVSSHTVLYRGSTILLIAEGANGINGGRGGKDANIINGGGGNGGNSNTGSWAGGGGAGGYTGNGGAGAAYPTSYVGSPGAGGGGGGGGSYWAGGGGGTGLMGQGANGVGGDGSNATTAIGNGGTGGSGGTSGINYSGGGAGGTYGGGNGAVAVPAIGSQVGAMRLIWGPGRAFPSTKTEDQDPEAPINLGRFQFSTGTNTQVVPAGANSAYLIMVGAGSTGGGSLSHGDIVVYPGETLTFKVDALGTGVYGDREGQTLALLGYAHASVGSGGGPAWRGGPYFKARGINAGAAYGPGGGGAAGYSGAGNSGTGGSGKNGSSGSSSGYCNTTSWGNGGGGVGLNGEGPSGTSAGQGGSGGGNGTGGYTYATGSFCVDGGGNRYSYLGSVGGNGGSFGGGCGSGGVPGPGGVAITFYNTILYGNESEASGSLLDARDQEANYATRLNTISATATEYEDPTSSNWNMLGEGAEYGNPTYSVNWVLPEALTFSDYTSSNNWGTGQAIERGDLQIYSNTSSIQYVGLGDLQIYSNRGAMQTLVDGELPDMITNINSTAVQAVGYGELQIYSNGFWIQALGESDVSTPSFSNGAITTALSRGDLQIYSNRVYVQALADNEINTVIFNVTERSPGKTSVSPTWLVTSEFVGVYRLDDSYDCDVILNGVMLTKAPNKTMSLALGDAIQFSAQANASYASSRDFTITGDALLYIMWKNKTSNRIDYLDFGFYNNTLPFVYTTEEKVIEGLDDTVDYTVTPYTIFSRNARVQFYINDSEEAVSEANVVNGDTIRLVWRGPPPNTFPNIVTYYLESIYQDEFYEVAEISSRAIELGDPFLRPEVTSNWEVEQSNRVTELLGLDLGKGIPRLTGVNVTAIQLHPVLMINPSFWTQLNPLLQQITTQWTQTTPVKLDSNQQWSEPSQPVILPANVHLSSEQSYVWNKKHIQLIQNPDFSLKVTEKLNHGDFSLAPVRREHGPTAVVDIVVVPLQTSSGATVDATFAKQTLGNLNAWTATNALGASSVKYESKGMWDIGTHNPTQIMEILTTVYTMPIPKHNVADKFDQDHRHDIKLAVDHNYLQSYNQRNWLALNATYESIHHWRYYTRADNWVRSEQNNGAPIDLNFQSYELNSGEFIDHVYQNYLVNSGIHVDLNYFNYLVDGKVFVGHKYDVNDYQGVFSVDATYKKHLDSQSYYFQVEYKHVLQVNTRGINSTFYEWTKAVRIPVGIGFEHVVYQSNYTFEVGFITGPDDNKAYHIDYDFVTRHHTTATVDNVWEKATEASWAQTKITPVLSDSRVIEVGQQTAVVQVWDIKEVGTTFELVRDPLSQVELLDGQAGYHTQQEAIDYALSLGFTEDQIRLFEYQGKYGFTTDPEALAAVCRIEPPKDGISKVIFWS